MDREMQILVVDDEESIRTVMSHVLSDEGYHVTAVPSAEEALELFCRTPFPVLIADIRLEGMDGIELLKKVKEVHPDTQVIIITSYGSMESAIEAMRHGAYDYLLKPFENIDQISFAVRKAVESRRLAMENVKLTKALEEKVNRLSIINDLGRAMHSIHNTRELLDFFVQMVADEIGADRVSLMLLDKGVNKLLIKASYGIEEELARKVELAIGEGIAGRVVKEGNPIFVIDVDRMTSLPLLGTDFYSSDSFISAPLKLSIPIKYRKETIGVINISNKRGGGSFSEEDLDFISLLTSQASHAIENARMFDEQKKTHFEVITALADVLEAKDSHTGSHSNRMYNYAMQIGEKLGLSAAEKERLSYVAILHDIGKIGIPESILQKPSKLTDEEFEIMKSHPIKGAEILKRVSFLVPVAPLIRHHHERFEGNGYPDRLKGEEIPIQSRIVSIIDAYDAMTSDRPYRKSLGMEWAIGELKRCAGTQFDPQIVEIFISILMGQE